MPQPLPKTYLQATASECGVRLECYTPSPSVASRDGIKAALFTFVPSLRTGTPQRGIPTFASSIKGKIPHFSHHFTKTSKHPHKIYLFIRTVNDRLGGVNDRLRVVNGRLGGVNGFAWGVNDRLRVVNDRLGGVNGRLCLVNGRLRGVNDRLRLVNDRLGVVNGFLRRVNDRLACVNDFAGWINGF
jgi:hypothetical protein